ncbi:hypothetical protein PIB30_090171 [Stylosanthes scabra]|uniref:Secreted protein n=1 Tax=Stylosanthes scabra TaxID=79078 RepID=A0ABU6XUW3_9FABA|nr:hypothetical protein [Stylosanthes scabra]
MALLISVLRGVICSGIFSGPVYDTMHLAHDGVAPQPGRVPHVQLFSGMHDTRPMASSHVFSGMHGTPLVASPHAFAGSHTFDQLHGTPPGSHVTGSSSGGSGSHGGKFSDLHTFWHDTDQASAGHAFAEQPPAEQHDADE